MKKRHAENTRIKRDYFDYLKGPGRQSEKSIDIAAKAIARLEDYTRNKDFKTFRKEQAIGFVGHLQKEVGERSGAPLSKATLLSTLRALKDFFTWLSQQHGFKSRFSYLDAEYFSLSRKETAIAQARRARPVPSTEQIRHVIMSMPSETDVERRDRALLALAIMTGARADALASLRLKHVDLAAHSIQQEGREVRTKFSSTFNTTLVPVDDDICEVFQAWVEHLRHDLLWGPDDPLFPKTRVVCGAARRFEADGLERANWSNSAPIRAIYRKAFAAAGVPYHHPHSLRHSLTRYADQHCVTMEERKAFSQNLGHASILTTATCYGEVSEERRGELIRNLKKKPADDAKVARALALIDSLESGRI